MRENIAFCSLSCLKDSIYIPQTISDAKNSANRMYYPYNPHSSSQGKVLIKRKLRKEENQIKNINIQVKKLKTTFKSANEKDIKEGNKVSSKEKN